MQRAAALVAILVSALALAGGASAAIRIGVADDFGVDTVNTPWFFDHLGELGMTENRVSVNFDAANPTTIQGQAALDLYVPLAALRGVRVVFSVGPTYVRVTETS